ncbi:MAG TPA: GTPase Era [Candidatus Azoamicus sp. OHIO2]
MNKIISIIGRSNVGKSSLFNNLIKKEISIVTNKRYTTNRCVEIESKNNFVLIDTPGPIIKKLPVDFYNTNKLIYSAINKSDILIVMVTQDLISDDFFILDLIKNLNKPKVLLISKVDKIKTKHILLSLIYKLSQYSIFDAIFPLSNLTLFNIERLKVFLNISENVFFSCNVITTDLVLDAVRQVLLTLLSNELPYNITVSLRNNDNIINSKNLYLIFFLKKECQKKIIVGKNGNMIKSIVKDIHTKLKLLSLNIEKIDIKFKYC